MSVPSKEPLPATEIETPEVLAVKTPLPLASTSIPVMRFSNFYRVTDRIPKPLILSQPAALIKLLTKHHHRKVKDGGLFAPVVMDKIRGNDGFISASLFALILIRVNRLLMMP